MIRLSDYPELKLIAWHVNVPEVEEEEAFALYERNWKWVDQDRLTDAERDLIDSLARRYGKGVLNV